jgi:hypothetical protein
MLCLPYCAYVFSSTKLEMEVRGEEGKGSGKGEEIREGGRGRMTQTMYALVNK